MTLEEFLALPEEKPALELEPDGTVVQKCRQRVDTASFRAVFSS
jgi:hypothetical protein